MGPGRRGMAGRVKGRAGPGVQGQGRTGRARMARAGARAAAQSHPHPPAPLLLCSQQARGAGGGRRRRRRGGAAAAGQQEAEERRGGRRGGVEGWRGLRHQVGARSGATVACGLLLLQCLCPARRLPATNRPASRLVPVRHAPLHPPTVPPSFPAAHPPTHPASAPQPRRQRRGVGRQEVRGGAGGGGPRAARRAGGAGGPARPVPVAQRYAGAGRRCGAGVNACPPAPALAASPAAAARDRAYADARPSLDPPPTLQPRPRTAPTPPPRSGTAASRPTWPTSWAPPPSRTWPPGGWVRRPAVVLGGGLLRRSARVAAGVPWGGLLGVLGGAAATRVRLAGCRPRGGISRSRVLATVLAGLGQPHGDVVASLLTPRPAPMHTAPPRPAALPPLPRRHKFYRSLLQCAEALCSPATSALLGWHAAGSSRTIATALASLETQARSGSAGVGAGVRAWRRRRGGGGVLAGAGAVPM